MQDNLYMLESQSRLHFQRGAVLKHVKEVHVSGPTWMMNEVIIYTPALVGSDVFYLIVPPGIHLLLLSAVSISSPLNLGVQRAASRIFTLDLVGFVWDGQKTNELFLPLATRMDGISIFLQTMFKLYFFIVLRCIVSVTKMAN